MPETVSGQLGLAACRREVGCSQGQPHGNHDLVGSGLSDHPAGVGWFVLILPLVLVVKAPLDETWSFRPLPSTDKTLSTGVDASTLPLSIEQLASVGGMRLTATTVRLPLPSSPLDGTTATAMAVRGSSSVGGSWQVPQPQSANSCCWTFHL